MEIKINLLPDYRKEEIAKSKRFRLVLRLGMMFLSVFFLFCVFLFGLQKTLEMELQSFYSSQEAKSNKEKLEKIRNYDEQFKGINSSANLAVSLEEDQLYWSNLFVKLSGSLSEGITITDLATKEYGVFLAGKAKNRESLMSYKEKLAEEKCFENVNLPLSNLISKEDISFQIDFKMNRECLQNKEQ